MAQDDWITWIVGGIIAVLGYFYITNQKAGAGNLTPSDIDGTANVASTGGCGCHR